MENNIADTTKDEVEMEADSDEQESSLPSGPLKQIVVDYVGDCLKPENDQVTLEMIIHVLAKEFPEIVLAVAEENFVRGYKQALHDADAIKNSPDIGPQELVVDKTDE